MGKKIGPGHPRWQEAVENALRCWKQGHIAYEPQCVRDSQEVLAQEVLRLRRAERRAKKGE